MADTLRVLALLASSDWTLRELADLLVVHPRTIRRHMQTLTDVGVTILPAPPSRRRVGKIWHVNRRMIWPDIIRAIGISPEALGRSRSVRELRHTPRIATADRAARYKAIRDMRADGLTLRSIGDTLGISAETVRRSLLRDGGK